MKLKLPRVNKYGAMLAAAFVMAIIAVLLLHSYLSQKQAQYQQELAAQLSVITDAATGLARYQNVETHPGARRRGLAGTLVWHAGQATLAAGRAKTLVIVAEPAADAIRLYRRVGFARAQDQIGFTRQPAG